MAGAYYVEADKRRLWIVPPKCGITSLLATGAVKPADLEMAQAVVEPGWKVIATMRHPYDRIVSALFNHLWDPGLDFDQRYQLYYNDVHVRPQSEWLDPFTVDCFVPFELQHVYWPLYGLKNFPHLNRGTRRPERWQDVDFDWRRLNQRYERDFEWNLLWERP